MPQQPRVLLLYSTTDGHTLRISQTLQQSARSLGTEISLSAIAEADTIDWTPFDAVVIGASIRYGKHSPQVFDVVQRHLAALQSKPSAFFTVNVVARKPEKNEPATNPYMRKFLSKVAWKPNLLGVFAGRINYPALGPLDRNIIRFIMWMTKGPTDPTGTFEFTDWAKVEAFAAKLAQLPALPRLGTH